MPFMSAIAREISRHYLEAAGRTAEAASLEWQPQLSMFPHPQLSPGSAGFILPPFIFVACMFATIGFLGVVVSEKETGLRQALQTMGLQQGSYWLSWWLFEAMMAGITAWCLIGFGKWSAHQLGWRRSWKGLTSTALQHLVLVDTAWCGLCQQLLQEGWYS
jgi:hypothetical protein